MKPTGRKPTLRRPTSVTPGKKIPLGSLTPGKKIPIPNAKPLTPAQRQSRAKRPMIGADKSANKKYGSKSNNNGYTN